MPSPDQRNKELDHIFFNLFELDPLDEVDWNENHLIFMDVLSEMALKHGTCAIVLLSHEELREILHEIKAKARKKHTHLTVCLSSDVRSLQLCLKNLQEKDCSHLMVVSTTLPSMSQILETVDTPKLHVPN